LDDVTLSPALTRRAVFAVGKTDRSDSDAGVIDARSERRAAHLTDGILPLFVTRFVSFSGTNCQQL
jgi:hypothetical protein